MMKNRRRLILLAAMVVVLCTITLAGCQLALPTSNTNMSSDKLCGVFVTIGTRNLTINDKARKDKDVIINKNGEINYGESTNASLSGNRYEGKITDDKHTVVFDGISGYYMGTLHEQDENGEYFNSIICDPGLTDVKYAINVIDNSEEQKGEATLYVSKNFHEVFYLNPVYLTSDGRYYTILSNAPGASFSGEIGTICSQTIDSEIAMKNEDSSKAERSSYKINVAVVDAVKKTVIKEMNQNDEIVKVTEYFPNSPEEFTVSGDTSYVIVEEELDSSSKVKGVKRSVYVPQPKDSNDTSNQYHCNFPGENGIITQKLIKFICE